MNRFLNILIFLCYIGLGYIYVSTTVTLYVFNEIISGAFTFDPTGSIITSVRERKSDVVVTYKYIVNSVTYQEKKDIEISLWKKSGFNVGDSIVTPYNTTYPNFSYIDGLYNEHKKVKLYLLFSPFVLIVIWATFANKDKWINRYRRAFGFPTKNSE